MLTPLGFEVREAASGMECIDSLEQELPDAILMDISMPARPLFVADDPLLAASCARLRSFVTRCELESLLDDLTVQT